MSKDTELSVKMRSYMAEIYRLIDRQPVAVDYVGTSELADLLNVSPPAVNRMVNKLKDLNLLDHEPYQGIAITEAGRIEALKHIRYQRIAESFLVTVMKMNWLEVYDEASQLSGGLSDVLVDRMYEMAGKPQFCPHGEPIPNNDGTIRPIQDTLLSQMEAGTRVKITRLTTREFDRLQYMEALGLVPMAEMDLIHVAPFNGPIQLKLHNEFRIIGNSLAELIRVQAVEQL
jgi:DtxR family transcriptional regulator, Mn-dependent transcriptional regulator